MQSKDFRSPPGPAPPPTPTPTMRGFFAKPTPYHQLWSIFGFFTCGSNEEIWNINKKKSEFFAIFPLPIPLR